MAEASSEEVMPGPSAAADDTEVTDVSQLSLADITGITDADTTGTLDMNAGASDNELEITLESILSTHDTSTVDLEEEEHRQSLSVKELVEENKLLQQEKKAIQVELLCMEGTLNRFKEIDGSQMREVEALTARLFESEMRYREREVSVKRMVDEMEELHENLAELDSRFARSEENNAQLKKERDEKVQELTQKNTELEEKAENMGREVNISREELKKLRLEVDTTKKEAMVKSEQVREAVAGMSGPTSAYMKRNKGSKSPLKKLKCYRLLKDVTGKLQTLMKDIDDGGKDGAK